MKPGSAKIVVGLAMLVVAFVLGIVVPAIQKFLAFNAIENDAPHEEVANHMAIALYSMATALLLGFIAIAIVIWGIISRRQARSHATPVSQPA